MKFDKKLRQQPLFPSSVLDALPIFVVPPLEQNVSASKKRVNYYPFGMTMPGRKSGTDKYRYSFTGQENDPEVAGDGNSVNFGERMYDPRLARWKSLDPYRAAYPSSSPYAYALNTPIGAKDEGGLYTIFVNGYIYGGPDVYDPGTGQMLSDDIEPGKNYWRGAAKNPDQFIDAAHAYLHDGIGRYVNGSGDWMDLQQPADKHMDVH